MYYARSGVANAGEENPPGRLEEDVISDLRDILFTESVLFEFSSAS